MLRESKELEEESGRKHSGRDVILFPSIGGKDQYNYARDKSNSSLHTFSQKENKQSPL